MKFFPLKYTEREDHEKALQETCDKLVNDLSFSECYALLQKKKLTKRLLANPEVRKIAALLQDETSANPVYSIVKRIMYVSLTRKAEQFTRYRIILTIRKMLDVLRYIPAWFGFYMSIAQRRHGKIAEKLDERGVCHGVSSVAVIAILNNKLPEFDATLSTVDGKQKTSEAAELLLKSIHQFQSPIQHTDKASTWQNVIKLQKIFSPELMNDPLALVTAIAGNHTHDSLTKLFEQMRYTIFADKNHGPIALQINNFNHSIAITYDFDKKGWRVIDASQSRLISHDDIADEVFSAMGTERAKNLILSMKIIASESRKEALKLQAGHLLRWSISNMNQDVQTAAIKRDSFGSQLFTAAAECGDIFTVKNLLNKGVDINQMNIDGLNALHYSACTGNVEMMDLLLSRDANVNFQYDHKFLTPLHLAVLLNQQGAVERLLQEKNIEIKRAVTVPRKTIENWASARKIPDEKVKEFLQRYRSKTLAHVTPLEMAQLFGMQSIVELLTQHRDAQMAKEEFSRPAPR